MADDMHDKSHTDSTKTKGKPIPMSDGTLSGETENMHIMSEEGMQKTQPDGDMDQTDPSLDMTELAKEDEARKKQEAKRKHRNWWIKIGLLCVLIGLSIYALFPITNALTGDGTDKFTVMVNGANLTYFLILLGVVLLYIVFESFQYSYILKTSTGKFRIRNSVKVSFLGKYYDGITPLGTGGQPFQIYYLHKKDIPKGVATAVPLVKYTFSTFAKGIFSIVFFSLIFIIRKDVTQDAGFMTVYAIAWVSMITNMAVPAVMIFGSLFPRAGKKLMIRIIALLAKMHIVKRKYKVTKKYVTEMSEYRRALKGILKRWWIIIPLFCIAMVTALINFSIPFFTALALVPNVTPTVDLWLQMFCGGLLAYYSASLIPTPGNSGGIESTSALVFASVLTNVEGGTAVAVWVIVVWRFFTYYMYIFSGIGISIFEMIRSGVRTRRAKKQAIQQ